MTTGQIRVAVVGTGHTGRGWAALVVASGWPVTLFDNKGKKLDTAPREIEDRARSLVELGVTTQSAVDTGLRRLQLGRSLLEACKDAQWIIEATSEDLRAKQRLFESIEAVAPDARAVTSSTATFIPKNIAAHVQRKDRCLVVHPLDPPELIPMSEVVPSPETDRALLEVVKAWLRGLGQIPVTLKRPIMGNVVGRITAAVMREAIELLRRGVIDPDDLDRAISLGPALAWTAVGPLLAQHLVAGKRSSTAFQRLFHSYEPLWRDLADWKRLEHPEQLAMIHAVERTYHDRLDDIDAARDRRMRALIKALNEVRRGGGRITATIEIDRSDEMDDDHVEQPQGQIGD